MGKPLGMDLRRRVIAAITLVTLAWNKKRMLALKAA